MARARPKANRRLSEVANLIIAEWYRVLPETATGPILPMDAHSLTAALNQVLDEPCQAVLDEPSLIKIAIPLPPATTKVGLDVYLQNNVDFVVGMSNATIFGCGR